MKRTVDVAEYMRLREGCLDAGDDVELALSYLHGVEDFVLCYLRDNPGSTKVDLDALVLAARQEQAWLPEPEPVYEQAAVWIDMGFARAVKDWTRGDKSTIAGRGTSFTTSGRWYQVPLAEARKVADFLNRGMVVAAPEFLVAAEGRSIPRFQFPYVESDAQASIQEGLKQGLLSADDARQLHQRFGGTHHTPLEYGGMTRDRPTRYLPPPGAIEVGPQHYVIGTESGIAEFVLPLTATKKQMAPMPVVPRPPVDASWATSSKSGLERPVDIDPTVLIGYASKAGGLTPKDAEKIRREHGLTVHLREEVPPLKVNWAWVLFALSCVLLMFSIFFGMRYPDVSAAVLPIPTWLWVMTLHRCLRQSLETDNERLRDIITTELPPKPLTLEPDAMQALTDAFGEHWVTWNITRALEPLESQPDVVQDGGARTYSAG